MSSFPNEVLSYSLDQLYTLLDVYFIRDHNGQEFDPEKRKGNSEEILQFIKMWLKPDEDILCSERDPVECIKGGLRFDPEDQYKENVSLQIFGYKIQVSPDISNDFAKYPMRNNFGHDPWQLLQDYITTPDRDSYFKRVTEVDPSKFLSNTERIFFLTRGYGRPNHYISFKDMELRKLYSEAEPTALIALMDILGICSTRQEPEFIKEILSTVDLRRIDQFHQNAVTRITECLRDISKEEKLSSFQRFLKSIGMISKYEYDPDRDVFISNLSQLSLYKHVKPSKKWDYNEVKSMPDGFIDGYLRELPDEQILMISTPYGVNIKNLFQLADLESRLRNNLINVSFLFLTAKRYFLTEKNVLYGRLVDEKLLTIQIKDFEHNIEQLNVLLDPYDNVISPKMAKEINETLNNRKIQEVIDQTNRSVLQTKTLINSIPMEQREDLRNKFAEAEKLKDLEKIVNEGPPELLQFILWSFSHEWVPIAITLNDYFKLWQPRLENLITDTIKYYRNVI